MCDHYYDLNKMSHDDQGYWSQCLGCGELRLFEVDCWEDLLILFGECEPEDGEAQPSVQPTLLACGHPATAIDPYDNSCLICRHENPAANANR